MTIKSAQQLVREAYSEVKTISTDEALNLVKDDKPSILYLNRINKYTDRTV